MSFFTSSYVLPAWVGTLPKGWRKDWLKWFVNRSSVRPTDNEAEQLPYISNEDIEPWTGLLLKRTPSSAGVDGQRFWTDDVLFNKLRPYLAKVYHARFDGVSSGELLCLRASAEVFPRFLFYVVSSRAFVDAVNAETFGSKMPRADWEIVGHQFLPLPPLETQKRIAAFLDEKTAQIDGLIARKQKLLELLAEKRQALITQAVTKGLNPAAPMKHSGIEWLGEIPAHWEVKRLRFYIETNPSKSRVRLSGEEDVSFLPMEFLGERGGMILTQSKVLDEVYTGYTYFAENDVCVAKITPCFENYKGAIAPKLINGVGFGTTELHVLRSSQRINFKFLFLITISYQFRVLGTSEMVGAGGQKRVPERFIKDWPTPLPPLKEQNVILGSIKKQLDRIDICNQAVATSVARLIEYRAALITSAVNGQIESLC